MKSARCAIYARYSTDNQREQSTDDQVRECRRYAEAQGWQVIDVVEDEGIPGASRHERVRFLELMTLKGAWDVLLCWDFARLLRKRSPVRKEERHAIRKRGSTLHGRGKMFRYLVGAAALLALACVEKVWRKPGATDEDFYRARASCLNQDGGRVISEEGAKFIACMHNKGWAHVPKAVAEMVE